MIRVSESVFIEEHVFNSCG